MKTVAIVDDEVDIVEGLSELLELHEFEVVGIGKDGHEAIALCKKYRPNFLILDLSMPNFDGFHVLNELKEFKSTKIIVVTGMVDMETRKKLESFSPFLVKRKPLNFDEMIQEINSE